MKMRNKGKVHPFSSSSSSSANTDSLSVLQLLPAVILSLVSALSLEERQVLAYMITRSLKSANPSFFPLQDKKKTSKNHCSDVNGRKSPPLFDCDCFHCYTSFWVRWDSSPNRELIHQAIEAFEEHLNNGEQLNKTPSAGKNKRKEKAARGRKVEKVSADGGSGDFPAAESPENRESGVVVMPESEVVVEEVAAEESAAPAMVVRNHKGLARKVLPDVMGIFSSRLWSLWNPEV